MRQRFLASVARVVLGVGVLAGPAATFARASGIDWTGRPAPDLYVQQELRGVAAGSTLATYRGKVLVLKFFFASCPTCRASLPEFEQLYRRYAGRSDVQFLALAYDSWQNVEPLVRGYSFPVALDPAGVTPHRYGVETYPTTYVIGTDGYVKAYDDDSSWVIDREAANAKPAVDPKVAAEALRQKNIAELGEVPAALAAAKEAAATNDYGAVLRTVEAHLDASKETAAVVAAAKRIQAVALARFTKRSEKIVAVWNRPDHPAAWRLMNSFESDFKGTSVSAQLAAWIAKFPEPRPAVAVAR